MAACTPGCLQKATLLIATGAAGMTSWPPGQVPDQEGGKRRATRRGGRRHRSHRRDPECDLNVINLSNRPLTEHEVAVLSKGLSFVPCKKADSFKTRIEMFKFLRSVKLRAFFDKGTFNLPSLSPQTFDVEPELTEATGPYRLRARSTFVPPALNPSVATFCRLVEQEVSSQVHEKDKVRLYSNISLQEKQALIELSKDTSVVVPKADKGGAIVLQSKEAYRDEILRQLDNRQFYTPLTYDPTAKFLGEVDSFLGKALNDSLISQNEYSFLFQRHPVRPVFYTLPKIHKVVWNLCLDDL
ncbi:hypothetical protein ABVT39_027248 [Epinephelus coioides]